MSRRGMLVAGSYHRHDLTGAAMGDASSLPFADQTLLGMISSEPSVVYTQWATQTGDVSWTEALATQNYQAFAISDQQLVAATTAATSAPQMLAVITPSLSYATQIEKAFQGTPYAYVRTEAIYAQLDPTNPPRILFLYWLQLRALTDPDTGPTSLNYAAANVLGVLSFILNVAPTSSNRPRPSVSFAQAFAQQTGAPLPAPTPVVVHPTDPITPASPSSPSSPVTPAVQPSAISTDTDKSKALLLVGLGAAAAFGGYQIFQHYRERG